MTEKTIFLTEEGKKKLESELEYLRTVRRLEVAERIHAAKEGGDIMENAGYEDAKNEQAFLEGRIRTLEYILQNAVLIDESTSTDVVDLGSRVTVLEEGNEQPENYFIVGSAEVDPASGRISNESPLGRALLGHRVGDTVTVKTPGGSLRFQILHIG
ncbi:MAG: transcription elongation factor GreA [Anaerolineae bacterium]